MIPKHAKSVYKGPIFEVFQWEQEMFDGSTQVFEALKRPDTAEVIATIDNRIVIQHQTQPHKREAFICIPGGRIEPGEDPLVGAKRELLEETGLASESWDQWFMDRPSGKIDWTIYVYVARQCKLIAEQKLDAGERITLEQVSYDRFLEMVDKGELNQLSPDLRVALVRAANNPDERERLRKYIFG